MPIQMIYIDPDFIDNNDNHLNQLRSCLQKIADAQSIHHLPCQPEQYPVELKAPRSLEKLSLWTARINLQARLFYTVYHECFIPITVCWDHNLNNVSCVNDKSVQEQLAIDIIKAVASYEMDGETLSLSTKETELDKERSPKSRQKIQRLSGDQEKVLETINKMGQASICIGPPGSGKTAIAKYILEHKHPGLTAGYLTLGLRLCQEMARSLSSAPSTAIPADHDITCDTWDGLHPRIIEIMNAFVLRIQQDEALSTGMASTANTKKHEQNLLVLTLSQRPPLS